MSKSLSIITFAVTAIFFGLFFAYPIWHTVAVAFEDENGGFGHLVLQHVLCEQRGWVSGNGKTVHGSARDMRVPANLTHAHELTHPSWCSWG